MGRLTRQQIDDLKLRLGEWHSPDEVRELIRPVKSPTLFNQSGLSFIREAWIAAKLGLARSVEATRLVADEWPDFELLFSGKRVEPFEAVEADDPTRRRGEEYRGANLGKIEHDPVEAWIERAEQAPLWLRAACKKKAGKMYSGGAGLAIYLNMAEYGIRQKEVEASLAEATEEARSSFTSIWILWKDKAYQTWP